MEERVKKIPRAKNAEIEAIQKAINAENERLETFLPRKKKNEFLPKECEKELRMGMWLSICWGSNIRTPNFRCKKIQTLVVQLVSAITVVGQVPQAQTP